MALVTWQLPLSLGEFCSPILSSRFFSATFNGSDVFVEFLPSFLFGGDWEGVVTLSRAARHLGEAQSGSMERSVLNLNLADMMDGSV